MRAAARHFVVLVSVVLALGAAGAARPAPAAAADPGGVPPTGIERPDLRTASSRTFQLADGRMVTQLYDKPIFYRPDGGSTWQPVDTHLSATADRTSALSANHAPSRIAFDAAGSALGFLRLRGAGHAINIGLPAALRAGRMSSMPQSQEDGGYAEYANFLPGGVDLRVFPETDGYSMFLVLASRPAVNSYSFTIDAPGLALGPDPLGTPDALAFTDASGNVVGEMPRPFMQDSSYVEGRGGGLYSEAVSMSYTGGNGHWLLTLSIDPAFLDGATYPVYVDPSVTSFPNANASAQDTFASSKYPGSNFNTYHRPDSPYYHEMWLGNEPGTSYYNQVFMRFQDINTMLGDVDIDSAYLEFYPYWQYWHSDPRQSQMKRITSSWQQNQLTWNNRPTVDANPYMSFYTTQGQFSHVDVTQYVQDVVDGNWVDHGLQLNVDSQGQGGWKRIVSLDDTNTSLLPHLDVTWHMPTYVPQAVALTPEDAAWDARDLHWYFDDGDGNDATTVSTQTSFEVQVATASTFGSSIIADSTVQPSSANTWSIPATVNLTSGVLYYWQVKVRDSITWSPWASSTFTWSSSEVDPSTGIDPDDDPVLSQIELGYTESDVQNKESDSDLWLDRQNPQWLEPCPEGCPHPAVDLRNDGFVQFHQKEPLGCVAAMLESVFNFALNSSWAGGMTDAGVAGKQNSIKQDLLAAKNDDQGTHQTDYTPGKGISSTYGIQVANQNLAAINFKYVAIANPVAISGSRLAGLVRYGTGPEDTGGEDMPVYTEVNVRSDSWGRIAWQLNPNGTRVTHAALAIGYYDDTAADILVGDPYLHHTTQVTVTQSGRRKPLYSTSGTTGVVWNIPAIDLADALDSGYDKNGNARRPVWY